MRGRRRDPPAHDPGMSQEPPKTTPTFYATGHLTGDEVWVAPDLPTLIEALIGDPGYRSRSPAGRLTARERCACELTTRTQAGLIQAAIREGTWSWEGASSTELDRLTRGREITDRDGPWRGGVPLILVRPPDSGWKVPAGAVKTISPGSDSALLYGMRELGWITSAGRLDSSGGVREGGRR
jgi:hypothetical protein